MNDSDIFSRPFFETASNGLLNYLFQEESTPSDTTFSDPFLTRTLSFDGHESDVFTDVSSVSTQRANDFGPGTYNPGYSYGISYQNKNVVPPMMSLGLESSEYSIQNSLSPNPSDSIELSSVPPSGEDFPILPNPLPESYPIDSFPMTKPIPMSTPKPLIKAKSSEHIDKRSQHNISEKKRIERMNQCISELYALLESSGVSIRKNKVTVLTETTKKIRHLESAVKELRQKVRDAEFSTRHAMSEICYKPVRSSVNYHVVFLQNPIPQAILAADGQFIDANSQFCSLTRKTVKQLREMTLFKFAHPDDLPCAFGSYSNMLREDNPTNGVCMIRHCFLGDCYQPVFFSLSLIRNEQNLPSYFVCNILPVMACTCTDTNQTTRKCSGILKGKNNKFYQICNPAELLPWCAQLIDTNTGNPIKQFPDSVFL